MSSACLLPHPAVAYLFLVRHTSSNSRVTSKTISDKVDNEPKRHLMKTMKTKKNAKQKPKAKTQKLRDLQTNKNPKGGTKGKMMGPRDQVEH
jgi:hypothetical protein